jgi:hypothetical protein
MQGEQVGCVNNPDLRAMLRHEQRPRAVVLTCADSRCPPELVLDQGLGDIFSIRVAGNVVDDHALGSVTYALQHLGARAVVLLGHTRCGAVKVRAFGGGGCHQRGCRKNWRRFSGGALPARPPSGGFRSCPVRLGSICHGPVDAGGAG